MNSSNSRLQEWERGLTPRVIKAKDWESQRENFTRLYSSNKYNLNEVRRIMANQYKFYARPKQCKTVIAKWRLGKNLRRVKTLSILRIQDDRRLAGKSTAFRFKGQRVKGKTLERGRKRYEGTGELPDWHKLPLPVSTPSDIDYFTPTPSNNSDGSSSSGSEGDTPSPISNQSFSRENAIDDTSLEQLINIEEYFRLDSFTGESSSLSLPNGEEQESAKRSSQSVSYNMPDQKLGLPIKSLDTSEVRPSTTCDVTKPLQKFPERAGWLESSQLKPACFDCLTGGFTRY
ncbi:hypothetical protein DFP73DRAFT_548196 [Morchella snyderi]|nr:hypothetical protein DFP73DRAFT_548196 [Morchella snyderi]